MNILFEYTLLPGELILTKMGVYEHLSIVSDRKCLQGKPMLISATQRNYTVKEEPYDVVVKGRPTGRAPHQSKLPAHIILQKARSQIGKWPYNVFTHNCEVFANWAAGLNVTSRQINGVLAGGVTSVAIAKIVAKELPPFAWGVIALAGCAIGLASTQALKQ